MTSSWNDPRVDNIAWQTRRHFLKYASGGLGALALTTMLQQENRAETTSTADGVVNPLAPKPAHFAAKAKRVIYIHCTGSPPHLDLFDYKPELVARTGEDCPDSFLKGRRFAFTSGVPKLLGTPRKFSQHGPNGTWMSDAIPHFHGVADEICLIKSMFTEQFNHAPAELLLYTGSAR